MQTSFIVKRRVVIDISRILRSIMRTYRCSGFRSKSIDISIHFTYQEELICKVISKSYVPKEAVTLVIFCIFIEHPIKVIGKVRFWIFPTCSVPSTLLATRCFVEVSQIIHIQLAVCISIQYCGESSIIIGISIRIVRIFTYSDRIVQPSFCF